MGTLRKAFYLQLALRNIRRSRRTWLPYMLATGIMSGSFLLITGLLFSETLNNLPSGRSATMVFGMGIVIFALFTFFFMTYINNYLIRQRKKEFGLYGILGMERRHVARVLLWENLITLLAGVLLGLVIALVFGRLLFLLLLNLIHTASDSRFSLSSAAYGLTGLLFLAVFIFTSLINLRQLRLSSPMLLLQSERRGEKSARLAWPAAALGLVMLLFAYGCAWGIEQPGIAIGVFFLLAALVIIATYLLFGSGSIALLKLLRRNKRLYYRTQNFIAISGMFQRMRQNARSLATICILSTMLLVTVSGTLALYLGQEAMLEGMYPYDVQVYLPEDADAEEARAFEAQVTALAAEHGVALSADPGKLVRVLAPGEQYRRNNFAEPGAAVHTLESMLFIDGSLRFDAEGRFEDCLAFERALWDMYAEAYEHRSMSAVFSAREEGFGVYGGLLFLGAFFGALFLAITVLIIYFKQISEGNEDKAQFAIMQKVGMDDALVKSTINRQVLWVFFAPLCMTALHMLFASRIIARMLRAFMLYDWLLVLACIGGAVLAFALVYLVIYRLTARVYYRIVKW
ncbi:MAG: FtsX-like permease family protein [Clostridia bacterium]|nr:FtsX-like permease family protein [Clostridia bacterium]